MEIDPLDAHLETDPPGATDANAVRATWRVVNALGRYYFRFECRGMVHVPQGPSLIVGNHSGGKIPIDVFLFAAHWYEHFAFRRPLYFLMHDIMFRPHPWLRRSLRRVGCVRASRYNVSLLLGEGAPVMVLPGGEYETFRPYRERNVIDFAGRSGFIRVALRHRVPITPVVSIGGHEIFYIVTRGEWIARMLAFPRIFRTESFPITLGLPFGLYLGPIPAPLPLPSRIVSQVLQPIWLEREEEDHPAYHAADAEEPDKVAEIYDVVRARMQLALDDLAVERRLPVVG